MIAITSEKETAYYVGYIQGFKDAMIGVFNSDRMIDTRQPQTYEQRSSGYYAGHDAGEENERLPERYQKSEYESYQDLINGYNND